MQPTNPCEAIPMASGSPAVSTIRNFRPISAGTLVTTGTSGTLTLAAGVGQDFEFKNVGTLEAFINLGTTVTAGGTVTAEGGGLSIPAGAILIYNFPNAQDGATIAAITQTGTTTLRVAQGTGS